MTRLALIGYGRIAPHHIRVFRALGCEFVAVCNRSEAGRERAMAQEGIPRAYATITEMVERERPVGVVCCPSFDQIHIAAQELFPLGVATLLEKPPGTSLAEYDDLCALSKSYRTPVMFGFNRRYYSVLRKAVEDAGGLDRITAVFVEWSENPRYLMNSRGLSSAQIKKWVFANSLHGLDLLTHLAGSFVNPAVAAKSLGCPLRWLMALQGFSERGVLGTFQSTWDSPGRWRLTFCVPGRRYVFSPLESCEMLTEDGQSRTLAPDEVDGTFKPGFWGQANEFLRFVRRDRDVGEASLESARPAMQLADMLTNELTHEPSVSDSLPGTAATRNPVT